MVMPENEASELTKFLVSEYFDIDNFADFFLRLKHKYPFELKLFDFEYYNEKRLEKAINEKNLCVKLQNFEKAAFNRDLEVECRKYLDLKSEFNIESSSFYFGENYLIYFYFGTARNDKIVREYLTRNSS